MYDSQKSLVRMVAAYDQLVKRLSLDELKTQEGLNMQRVIADARSMFTPGMNLYYIRMRSTMSEEIRRKRELDGQTSS